MDAKSFYEARDSRTLKLVDSADYRNKRVLIAIDRNIAKSLNGQVMLLVTSNLLSRFCRNISLMCDSGAEQVHIPRKWREGKFESAILRMLRRIDPFGDFRLVNFDDDEYDHIIAIGNPQIRGNPSFGIDSNGWLSYVKKDRTVPPLARRLQNPMGASASACMVVSEAFKSMLGIGTSIQDDVCFSTFDYSVDKIDPINPNLLGYIDLKDVQMVGCGALGSAVSFFLSMLPVTGTITLIDHDQIEVSNLNRCPTFTIEDVGKMKVSVIAEYLSETDMKTNAFSGRYSEFVDLHGAGNPDVVLSLVDENKPRHEIQMNMPKLILYGATGEWTLTVGRHRALEDDCHICRFPEIDQKNGECATVSITRGELDEATEEFSASASFISSTAALLVVSELVKISLFGYTATKNFLQWDMSLPLRTIRQHERKKSKDCVCNEIWFQETYKRKLNDGQTGGIEEVN